MPAQKGHCRPKPREPRNQTTPLRVLRGAWFKEVIMTASTVLIVILILVLIGALPSWGYSRNWGYAPSGLLGVALIIVIILMLTGRV
jgi:sterol desaturase/sphingolipid hydroxylase (fatty acid hydroxylase superfamily)